jgi:hypothetical protein
MTDFLVVLYRGKSHAHWRVMLLALCRFPLLATSIIYAICLRFPAPGAAANGLQIQLNIRGFLPLKQTG